MNELSKMADAARTDPLAMTALADRLAEGQDAATILRVLQQAAKTETYPPLGNAHSSLVANLHVEIRQLRRLTAEQREVLTQLRQENERLRCENENLNRRNRDQSLSHEGNGRR